MRSKSRRLGLLLAMVLAVVACTSPQTETTNGLAETTTSAQTVDSTAPAETTPAETTSTTASTTGGRTTLIIGLTQQVVSLDPADTTDLLGRELMVNVNSPLFYEIPGEADTIPAMAESPAEVSDGGLTYTVRLREDIMFADGLQLTAPLYAQLFQRQLTLGGAGPVFYVLRYVDSVEATDEFTLVFHLKQPFTFFPAVLTVGSYTVGHPDIFPEDELVRIPETPVYGTGPWMITEIVEGERIVLERNPFYFGEDSQFEQIILRLFASPATMALALQNREIDIASKYLDQLDFAEIEDTEGVHLGTLLAGNLLLLTVNHKLPPTDNPDVRRAIAATVDRDELVDRVFGGIVQPSYSPIYPGASVAVDVFDDMYGSPDIDLAREYLAKAGYSEENPVELVVTYAGPRYGELSVAGIELFAEQLERTGLFVVDLQSVEPGTYFEALFAGESYNLSLVNKTPEIDPSQYIANYTVASGVGNWVTDQDNVPYAEYGRALLDQLSKVAVVAPEDANREFALLQELYADAVVTLPLWVADLKVGYLDGISGDSDLPGAEALNHGYSLTMIYDRITKR